MISLLVSPIMAMITIMTIFSPSLPAPNSGSEMPENLASSPTGIASENNSFFESATIRYSVSALQLKALRKWLEIRRTRTKEFLFMAQAVDLKAYMLTCPQQDQDWPQDTSAIDTYIGRFLVPVISSFYEEEGDYLNTLPPKERSAFFKNTAKTIYDFDLGQKVATSPNLNANIDHEQRILCQQQTEKVKDLFIRLTYQLKRFNSAK